MTLRIVNWLAPSGWVYPNRRTSEGTYAVHGHWVHHQPRPRAMVLMESGGVPTMKDIRLTLRASNMYVNISHVDIMLWGQWRRVELT